ncbi:uncharacterized protein METZ01_LOCUS194091, partial [marine metagenome]
NPCYYWIVIIIGTRFGTNFLIQNILFLNMTNS